MINNDAHTCLAGYVGLNLMVAGTDVLQH